MHFEIIYNLLLWWELATISTFCHWYTVTAFHILLLSLFFQNQFLRFLYILLQPLRNIGNIFVVNLALADFCITGFIYPFSIIGKWVLNNYADWTNISLACVLFGKTQITSLGYFVYVKKSIVKVISRNMINYWMYFIERIFDVPKCGIPRLITNYRSITGNQMCLTQRTKSYLEV